jgi:DNA-binding CsgD family transcriptional regulator
VILASNALELATLDIPQVRQEWVNGNCYGAWVASLAANHGVQPKPTEIWQRLKSLTPREVDVLCYVLSGQLNKEIAAELGIGEKTIKVHRGHVMEKLGVQSSGQLLAMVLSVILTKEWNSND